MARMIDGDKLIELYKEQYLHYKSMKHGEAARAWQGAIQMLYDMPTLTQPNEPLTFVERREMDRKPIWLDDEKAFGILQFWDDNNVDAVFLDPSGCICVKSVIGKKIYRRPPEGEEETP